MNENAPYNPLLIEMLCDNANSFELAVSSISYLLNLLKVIEKVNEQQALNVLYYLSPILNRLNKNNISIFNRPFHAMNLRISCNKTKKANTRTCQPVYFT